MSSQTLHEALASLDITSEPSAIEGKRLLTDAYGETFGPFDAAEGWEFYHGLCEKASSDHYSRGVEFPFADNH